MEYITGDRKYHSHKNSSHTVRHGGASRNNKSLRLDLMSEPCLRGDSLEYDEVDLVSECSSPVAYVPGRYLQLCDISPDSDHTMWPVSLGPKLSEGDITSLLPSPSHRGDEESFSHVHNYRKSSRLTLSNPRLFIPVVVCVMLAFAALGGLAMVL